MERAGRAVARAAIAVAGGRYGRRAVVVCGPGNNGGDGVVAARVLRRAGLGVTCLLIGDPGAVRGAAAVHLEGMRAAGVDVRPLEERALGSADVVVDALFGTGFHGAADGAAADAISAVNACGAPVVAVDIPSGVEGATGRIEGPAIDAAVTVTMGAEKIGTALPPGSLRAGTVTVADIGIAIDAAREVDLRVVEADDVGSVVRPRAPDAHKRSAGSVVVVAGCDAIRGAPLLTARGAIRAGAGYVTVATTSAVTAALATSVPEALSVAAGEGELGPDALDALGTSIARADAVAIGPGLGVGGAQAALVRRAVAEIAVPLVLDADALNVLAPDPEPLARRGAPAVITPHPAELARLLGGSTAAVVADRLAAAVAAARRFPHTVVLAKGHRTVVAWNGGRDAVVVTAGGPELATAGSGDVLTGAVAALVASGCRPADAAWAGAWLHAAAGADAAARYGVEGVAAGDVADCLGPARARRSGAPR